MMRIVLIALAVMLSPAAWAQDFNQFVQGLPMASALGSGDLLYVLQGGASKNVTVSALGASFLAPSGTPSTGYVPIATGSTTVAWGTNFATSGDPAAISCVPYSFGGTWTCQYNFGSTYTLTHTDFRSTLNVFRDAVGSGGSPGGAQDNALQVINRKTNYLTSTVTGDNGGLYIVNAQGINGDGAGLQIAATKTYSAGNTTSGNLGAQIAATWNDSSGNVLQEIQTAVGWNIPNGAYPQGGVGFSSESWGATPSVSASQINPYALYFGGVYDVLNDVGAGHTPFSTNFIVASNGSFSGGRGTAHEYFKVGAGLAETGTITIGSASATGIDGTTPTGSGGIPLTLSNVSGALEYNNGTWAVFPTTGVSAQGGYIASSNIVAISAGTAATPAHTFSSTANFGIFFGSGVPSFSAAQGSVYMRSDGAMNARLYINTNGSTGWTAFSTAS